MAQRLTPRSYVYSLVSLLFLVNGLSFSQAQTGEARRAPVALQAPYALSSGDYSFHPDAHGSGFRGANKVQQLAYHCLNQSFYLKSTPEASHQWAVTYQVRGLARNQQKVELPTRGNPSDIEHLGHVLQLHYPGLTLEYQSTPAGVRQNFHIPDRPAGAGPLSVVLNLETQALSPALEHGKLVYRDALGQEQLRYEDLRVWDAAGKILPAHMKLEGHTLRLVVDDREASYPLVVDPLSITPLWQAEGDQIGAYFGSSASGAGDVNNDGFDDVVVGAPYYDTNGNPNAGRVFLYLGTANGLSSTPSWTYAGTETSQWLGWSVDGAGDVNGDGFDDLVIGSPNYSNDEPGEGAVYVFLGSASGPAASPDWVYESNQAGALLGVSVAGAGDVNNDGFDDVVTGAYQYSSGQVNEGRALAFHGGSSGLARSPSWSIESDQANAQLGISIAGAGDVNNDGFDDVVVGALGFTDVESREGGAFVYLGSASGLESAAVWTGQADQAGAQYGLAVAGAGDVNNDGFDDIVVGAPYFDANAITNTGQIFVYAGNASGVEALPLYTASASITEAQLGISVAGIGDLNGDGFDEVIAGAWKFSNGETDEGQARVYFGSDSPDPVATPGWTLESNQSRAQLGVQVAPAGDVDNDGAQEFLVSADRYDNPEPDEGAVFLYSGTAAGGPVSTAPPVIINEWSQGSVAGQPAEWVELLVAQENVDLTDWTVRDEQGTLFTFSPNARLWQSLPKGTIIVVYNGGIAARDPQLPEDDDKINDCNYRIILGSNNAAYFTNRNWNATNAFSGSNATDNPRLYRSSTVFADSTLIHDWDQGDESAFTDLALRPANPGQAARFSGGTVDSATTADFWTLITPGNYDTDVTPGAPNGGANDTLIYSLRLPSATLRNPGSVPTQCSGDTLLLDIWFWGGEKPWSATLASDRDTFTFNGINTTPFRIELPTQGTGEVSYELLTINGLSGSQTQTCGIGQANLIAQPLPPQTETEVRVCGPGLTTFTASGTGGNIELRWYLNEQDQTPVATGPAFSTALASSDSFYVSVFNLTAGCGSQRVGIGATVGTGDLPGVCVQDVIDVLPGVDGVIRAAATGGTGGTYNYILNGTDFQNTTGVFEDINPGLYTVTAVDSNNCRATSGTIAVRNYGTVETSFRVMGSFNRDEVSKVIQTVDGGYLFAGQTLGFNVFGQQGLVFKTGADLSGEWIRTFGDQFNGGSVRDIIQTRDGGYLAVGHLSYINNTSFQFDQDMMVLKLQPNGNTEWRRTFTGDVPSNRVTTDTAYSALQTADGGYVITGTVSDGGNREVAVIRLDSLGNVVWENILGGLSGDGGLDVIEACDGSIVVVGNTQSASFSTDAYVTKIDREGNVLWQQAYGDQFRSESASAITLAEDGDYVIVGSALDPNFLTPDALAFRIGPDGALRWATRFGDTQNDAATDVHKAQLGDGFVVSGTTRQLSGGQQQDAFLVNLDAQGNINWFRIYGASQNDQGNSFTTTSDGGYVLTGQSLSFGAGDFMVAKTDALGRVASCSTFQRDGTKNQTFFDLDSRVASGISSLQIADNAQPNVSVTSPAVSNLNNNLYCLPTAPAPTAELTGAPTTACVGSEVSLNIRLTGLPPWTVRYQEDGQPPVTVTNIASAERIEQVIPSRPGAVTYRLLDVRDGNGNTGTVSGVYTVDVTDSSPATAMLSGQPAELCTPGPVSLTVDLTGTPPWTLTYRENNGADITEIDINTTPYTLNVTPTGVGTRTFRLVNVQDNSGCTGQGTVSGSVSVTVRDATPVVVELVSVESAECSDNQGIIEVQASGGTGDNFAFTLQDTLYTNSSGRFTGLSAGNYIVQARSGPCIGVLPVEVPEQLPPSITSIGAVDPQQPRTVDVNWSEIPNAINYQLSYREAGTSSWTELPGIDSTAVQVTLDFNTSYEFRVRVVCSNNLLSAWSGVRVYTTGEDPANIGCFDNAPNIEEITVLATDNNRSRVIVRWSEIQGASTYTLAYRTPPGSSQPWVEVRGYRGLTGDLSLNTNTEYEFRVRTVCRGGIESDWSPVRVFETPPSPRETCLLTRPVIDTMEVLDTPSRDQVRVHWQAVPNAVNYAISYRQVGQLNWAEFRGFTGTDASITLTNGRTFEVRVQALCPGGSLSEWSAPDTVSVPSNPADVCIQGKPEILQITAIPTPRNAVRVAWTPVTGAVSYSLFYRVQGTATYLEVPNISNTTVGDLAPLAPNTTFEFRVVAECLEGGRSQLSDVFTFTTPEGQPSDCALSTPEITDISTVNSSEFFSTISVGWTEVTSALSYDVSYRVSPGGDWVVFPGLVGTNTNLILSNNTYEFKVVANCGGGETSNESPLRRYTVEGDVIDQCTTTAPGIVNITTAGGQARNAARVSWSIVNGATGYTVGYRVANTGNPWINVTDITSTNTEIVVDYNVTYEFRVRAACSGGADGPWSQIRLYTSPSEPGGELCPAPTEVQVTTLNGNSARVNWTTASDEVFCYVVSYGPAGTDDNNWPAAFIQHPGNTFTMRNLLPEQNYSVQVRSNCDLCSSRSGSRSSWSQRVNFSTPGNRMEYGASAQLQSRVYPNPNQGRFTLEWISTTPEPLEYNISDPTGRIILSRTVETFEVNQPILQELELSQAPAGLYLLHLKQGSETRTMRILIVQ